MRVTGTTSLRRLVPRSISREGKAAQEAARKPSSDEGVSDESRRYCFRRLEMNPSAGTEAELPTSTSKAAITSFDQLLKNHRETLRAASAASATLPHPKPAEVLESTRSMDSIDERNRVTRVTSVSGRVSPLRNTTGRYLETCVEKLYQVLKPHMKGMRYGGPGAYRRMRRDLRDVFEHGLKETSLKYGYIPVLELAHSLAVRGLFLVDFDRFPRYRDAAEEARKLVPSLADRPLRTDGDTSEDASQLPSPYPWESVRLPNMHDIEPTASRDTIPDFQRILLLPAPGVLQGPKTNESSNITETERLQLSLLRESVSDLKQTTEPNAAGLQTPHPAVPELSEQVLEQNECSNSATLGKPELPAHDQFGTPSKTVAVTGSAYFRKKGSKKLLFNQFATFSPIKLEVPSRHVALITFTDIEAATKAVKAKHHFPLFGKLLRSAFTNQVHTPVVSSRELVNDHVLDLPSLPGDTWDEHPGPGFTPVKGKAVTGAPTYKTVGDTSKTPAQSTAYNPLLPSNSHLPDLIDMTNIGKESSKSGVETPDDKPGNEPFQYPVPASAMSDGFGTDEGIMSTKLSSSDLSSPNSRWYNLLDARDLKKGPNIDFVDSELSLHASMAVPETRSYYLPHSVQHKILCGLQASLERVCFKYIMRTTPKLLQGSRDQWEIDNPHALELNDYMRLLTKLDAFGLKPVEQDNDRSMSKKLLNSMSLLRNVAVHRKRSNIPSLRRWVHEAYTLATIAGDSKAAAQFENLGKHLVIEQQRMKADRKEAEERLLATVKALASKRAELDRLEQEAMNRFSEEHKQIHAHHSADLSEAIDTTFSLDYDLGLGCEKTSSTEPTSPIESATAIEPALTTVPTILPAELSMSTIEPALLPVAPTTLPIMPTALSVERTILPAEPLSLVPKDNPSTDPVSGIFGRLKLWYGA